MAPSPRGQPGNRPSVVRRRVRQPVHRGDHRVCPRRAPSNSTRTRRHLRSRSDRSAGSAPRHRAARAYRRDPQDARRSRSGRDVRDPRQQRSRPRSRRDVPCGCTRLRSPHRRRHPGPTGPAETFGIARYATAAASWLCTSPWQRHSDPSQPEWRGPRPGRTASSCSSSVCSAAWRPFSPLRAARPHKGLSSAVATSPRRRG